MEKLFKFSFQAGKWFTSIFIVVLILSAISSIIFFACQFKQIKLNTIQYNPPITQNNTETSNQNKEYYVLIGEEISKELGLTEFGKDALFENIENYAYNQRDTYVDGLKPYMADFLLYVKEKKYSGQKWGDEFVRAISEYNVQFEKNWNTKELKETQQAVNRGIGISTFAGSILLFLLCLIIPLLIKIEENTRK